MKDKLHRRLRFFKTLDRQPKAIEIISLGLESLSDLVAAGQQHGDLTRRRICFVHRLRITGVVRAKDQIFCLRPLTISNQHFAVATRVSDARMSDKSAQTCGMRRLQVEIEAATN